MSPCEPSARIRTRMRLAIHPRTTLRDCDGSVRGLTCLPQRDWIVPRSDWPDRFVNAGPADAKLGLDCFHRGVVKVIASHETGAPDQQQRGYQGEQEANPLDHERSLRRLPGHKTRERVHEY